MMDGKGCSYPRNDQNVQNPEEIRGEAGIIGYDGKITIGDLQSATQHVIIAEVRRSR
jgi:hypothetical protein